MHDESGERAGRFFLKQRGPQGIWYICWYNPATRQAQRVSTGTRDREAARTALYEHALLSERPAAATDAALATVMQTCWLQYARHLPSADTHRAAQRNALEIWGDISVSGLDRKAQKQFVDKLRTAGLSDWTILSRLSRVFAAIRWYKRDCATLIVPEQITASDWKPHLPDRERTFSVEELAALFNAAASGPAAPKPEKPPAPGEWGYIAYCARRALQSLSGAFSMEDFDAALRAVGLALDRKGVQNALRVQLERGNAAIDSVSGVRGPGRAHHVVREGITGGGRHVRYRAATLIEEPGARPVIQSREHWWRFLVLAVGTASREAALRELTWTQIDLRRGIIRLNPEGRRQTKKRRATIKMCPTLLADRGALRGARAARHTPHRRARRSRSTAAGGARWEGTACQVRAKRRNATRATL